MHGSPGATAFGAIAAIPFLIGLPVSAQAAPPVGDSTQTLVLFGQLVPYRLYVPDIPAPASGFPLLIALHGGGDDHHKYFTGYDNGEMKRVAQHVGMVVACPRTAPYGGYRGAAETEVKAVLEDVLSKLPIDRGRVYLFGHSMGGVGALELLAAHPERFAAAASFAGPVPPTLAGAFRNKPVYLAHGDRDEIVPVEHSRRLAAAIERAGGRVRYHEIAGADHNSRVAAEFSAILSWLAAQGGDAGRVQP
ncbi:prolyl oligopeptidase family serine peptidase [bacterium]|nr:prolyl oligopeptidase family serine peptidase [bacterium]